MNKYLKMYLKETREMTRLEYNNYRGWTLPENEDGNDRGYLVVYDNGHENWIPELTFRNNYFEEGNVGCVIDTEKEKGKVYGTTDQNECKKVVPDVVMFGDDLFKLLSKASSQSGRWMKSTKAMEIKDVGCVVQVTTQQGDNIAETVTFVPGVEIKENLDPNTGKVVGRKLVLVSCEPTVYKI